MSTATKPYNKAGLHCELTQLALATGLCVVGASAFAQDTTLSTVTVQDSATTSFKVDEAPSSKFTAPLLNTPKTVTVINEEVLKQTGATSLQEALRATPGITFGNGEGGNPTGDMPFIRGADAQSSTFVDGMRDIASGSREVFNLESVEVIKGADSAYAGRGGAGGSINLSTKKAKNENFISGDVGLGTDKYKRATLDLNRKLSETTGLRLNVMAHDADLPGRNGPTNERWGIAPTVTFGMGTATEVTLAWQHLKTDNIPDVGMPYNLEKATSAYPGGSTIKPTTGGNRNHWYGLLDRDYEKSTSDLFTASIQHKFTDTNKFRSALRYSTSDTDYIWTQPDDSKLNVKDGMVYRRGNSRVADVTTLQSVSEFTGKAHSGDIAHSFALGLELSQEKSEVYSRSGLSNNALATKCGSPGDAVWSSNPYDQWCASLTNPNNSVAWTIDNPVGANPTKNKVDTVALYAFDTLQLNAQWLLNGGLRLDHYKIRHTTSATPAAQYGNSENLWNYQLGVVYKPSTNGSIYASLGTSTKPGGSALGNGLEDQAITSDALADLKAEKTRALELGTKWDLLNNKLGLSAALFRNEVTNARITENSITYMGGNKVVNGVELGFNGQITSQLNVFGGYTFMDSKQKDMGAGNIANGQDFLNTPKHSFSLWTSYKPTSQLTLGLGATAQSSVNSAYAKGSDGGVVTKMAPGYARYDAMASYQIDANLALQVNLYNLTDKVYYSGVRSTHYANIGAGRSAVAALKFTY